jgi:multisubunit Na+/H+ antiporter MnhB subunit
MMFSVTRDAPRSTRAISASQLRADRPVPRSSQIRRLPMMNALPLLIVIWAVFTGLFLSLLAYNATLTRYEENQLFLDEINSTEKQLQSSIVNKVNKILPYIKAMGTLSGVMTVVIIAIFTIDAWQKIQQ